MTHILIIDLGTTYFKFTLFDRTGRLCDVVRFATPIRAPHPGYMEVDAEQFVAVVLAGIAQLRERNAALWSGVGAVSFATQTNSFVLLDGADRPLTPIVLWPDTRAGDFEAELRQRAAIADFTTTTGIPGVNLQFMIAKLLFWRRHAPELCRRMRKLCLVSDYLTLLMTGRHVTEAGTAALTALVDIRRCQWWPAMLDRVELDPSCLAEVVRAGTDLGPLLPAAAERFGLARDCRFVVGCLDQYAGAMGAGNVRPGAASETTGTVLSTVRCNDRLLADPGVAVVEGPAFAEGVYYQMAFGEISANYLEWYRNLLAERPEFETLAELARAVEPGAGGLRLRLDVPRTTVEDVFAGLLPRHTRGQMVRCIMETVAVALRDQVDSLYGGQPPAEIRSAGGAARSDLWLQIKADVLGIAVTATQCPEPTSLGAAMLAETAASGAKVPQIASRWIRPGHCCLPDPERHRRYQELYPRSTVTSPAAAPAR
jgi:xylulokinase